MPVRFNLKSTAAILVLAAMPAAGFAQNASLDNLTASQNFPAYQSTMKYSLPTTGGPQGFGNHARVTASIQYNHAAQSYTVRDTGNIAATSTFAPVNKVLPESNTTYTVYRKVNGSTTETLRLLNPGAANPLIQLTYASYGSWRKSTTGATATAVADTYFVYGIKTGADMPHSGSATFTGLLDGTYVNRTAVYALSGPASFSANFLSGQIGFSATPTGTPSVGSAINFNTINGSGPINNSSFKAQGSNGTYQMDMAGYFFGPAAAEIGATFRLKGGSGATAGSGNGAIVGKRP